MPEKVKENNEKWRELILKPSLESSLASQIIEPIQDKKTPKDYSVILFGPPGTGKTTIPFAMANELDWDLFYINPRHFFKKGYSVELAISECFEDIRKYAKFRTKNQNSKSAKCIFVFDEIDELVTERNDDADRQSRMITTMMLPLFNDLRKYAKEFGFLFFVLTNHIQRFDPAIKRKGRFDLILPVGPPSHYARFLLLEKIVKGVITDYTKQGIVLSDLDLDYNILSLSSSRMGYGDIKNVCNRAIDQMVHLDYYPISKFSKTKKNTSTPNYVLPHPLNTSMFLSWFNRQRNSTKDIQSEIDRFYQECVIYTRSASPSIELGQVQEKAEDEFAALHIADNIKLDTIWKVSKKYSFDFIFKNLSEINSFDGKIDVILNGAGFNDEPAFSFEIFVNAGSSDKPVKPIIIKPKSKGSLRISCNISGHFVLHDVSSTEGHLSYLKGERRVEKTVKVT